jgi:phage gp36-like protein
MPYSTRSDILNQLDESTLMQLTSDTGAVIDDVVVSRAIFKADSIVNSYAGKKYVVPFDPVPEVVNTTSASVAIYLLFQQKSSKVGGVSDSVRKAYEDAISWLKDVSVGKAVIDGAIPALANPKTTGGSMTADKRIFDNKGLKNW